MANNQSVRRHLDAFTRGRIIGKVEEGRSVTSVAAEFRIAHSIWRERGSRNHPSNIIEKDRYGGRGVLRRYGSAVPFLDDNAPCHRTVAAEQLLESEDIERMDWPARSPDLNPIEHVWDFLGRHLAARTLPPVTIQELRLALQDEWAAMPQQLIDTPFSAWADAAETCLAVRGDHIPY
ncbi:transposable element Tcb2 transposase [Trichonephila clavipes]|nr:transposable element Tcb2 transposase [Trichonephila clavipes]